MAECHVTGILGVLAQAFLKHSSYIYVQLVYGQQLGRRSGRVHRICRIPAPAQERIHMQHNISPA